MADAKMFFVLLLSVSFAFVSSDKVPVLIWTNDESVEVPSVLAGHSIQREDFTNHYLPPLTTSHNLVVFIQDALSVDDLTKFADVYNEESDGVIYKNLKSVMESGTSTHLPSVSSPVESLLQFKASFTGAVHTSDGEVTLDSQKRNLVFVSLPSTRVSHEDHTRVLRQIDSVIGSVNSQMEADGRPFTALYTGQASSKVSGGVVYAGGRHLLQQTTPTPPSANYTFINSTAACTMFYAQSITIVVEDAGTWVLPPINSEDPASSCQNGTAASLIMKFTEANKQATMNMTFTNLRHSWKLADFTISYEITMNSTTVTGQDKTLRTNFMTQTPRGFSYHCYQGPLVPEAANKSVSVRFTDLQVQVFGPSYARFGYHNDCVGFFTIPIWSGILSMLLLVAILSFGILMLANITTMDRFDDAKGKTITVNVVE